MKAITFSRYGSSDVLEFEDVETPTAGDGEVLVAVRASSVNPIDWHFMTGLPYVARVQFGLRRPKLNRIGYDLAGVVDSVGAGVETYAPGDEVFGNVGGETERHPLPALGSCAEYVAVPDDAVVAKPAAVTFEQAATVSTAGLTALQGLRDLGRIESGQHVLINGASGGVGTFAVQLAAWFGAEVTGVCSTRNVDLVRSLGADHVVDYTRDDFVDGVSRYDLMLDLVGNRSLRECRSVLAGDGVYVSCFGRPERRWLGPTTQLGRMMVVNRFVGQDLVTWVTRSNRTDLLVMQELLADGTVTPVVDRTYPLAEVPDAMAHLATGHARGKVAITI